MAIRYTQNVAVQQIPFQNLPGGGPLSNPSYTGVGAAMPIQFNDAGLEIGSVKEVTAIYQMQGNETVGDIINIYLAQPNSMVVPAFSSVSASPSTASTLTISVGDDDVTGYGLVSSNVAFSATPLPTLVTPQGASTTRYSTSLSAIGTNPNAFVGGTAFADPYVIGTLAVEPVGGSPGTGISGSWIQATILTIVGQTGGKCLVFRLKVVKP